MVQDSGIAVFFFLLQVLRSQTWKSNDASTPLQPENMTFKLATEPDTNGKQNTTGSKHSFPNGIGLRSLLGTEN